MDKIKVIVSKDWAGDASGDTPVLIFDLPFADFGESDARGIPQERVLRIVKRTMMGPVDGMARALTFLPATLRVPGFTMEMCQADVLTWHEVVNLVHEAQALLLCIDDTFVPGVLVEEDDLSTAAVEDALGTDEFDLEITKGCESFWMRSEPAACASCPIEAVCDQHQG